LLTLSAYFKLKDIYFKKVPEDKFYGLVHGVGTGDYMQPDDYILQHYIISSSPDYPLMVYNNNFPMHGPPVHHHHPHHMMDNGFYASPDSMYNGTPNGMPPPGGYDAMQYGMYYNDGFGQGP